MCRVKFERSDVYGNEKKTNLFLPEILFGILVVHIQVYLFLKPAGYRSTDASRKNKC